MIRVEGDSITLTDPTGNVIHTNRSTFLENCVALDNPNTINSTTVLFVLGVEITVKELPSILKKTIVNRLQSGGNRRSKL